MLDVLQTLRTQLSVAAPTPVPTSEVSDPVARLEAAGAAADDRAVRAFVAHLETRYRPIASAIRVAGHDGPPAPGMPDALLMPALAACPGYAATTSREAALAWIGDYRRAIHLAATTTRRLKARRREEKERAWMAQSLLVSLSTATTEAILARRLMKRWSAHVVRQARAETDRA